MIVLAWNNPHWFKQTLALIKREHSEKETIKGIYGIKKNTICLFAYILNEKRGSMLLIYEKKKHYLLIKREKLTKKRNIHTYMLYDKKEKKRETYILLYPKWKETNLLILIDIIN